VPGQVREGRSTVRFSVRFSVRFTETMAGMVRPLGAAGPPLQPFALAGLRIEAAARPGPDDGLPGRVVGGEVRYLGRCWAVRRGSFLALARAADGGRRLQYHVDAANDEGRIDVRGVKTLTGGPLRWWRQTTTLAVAVRMDGEARISAVGTLRLPARGFARQLTTMRGRPSALAAFGLRFPRRLPLRPRSEACRAGTSHPL